MALDDRIEQGLSRVARGSALLDQETEARLARAWRDFGDKSAIDRLIRAYLRLAISVAARYRRYAPMNDLVQEASLGLMKAAEKFDPDRGLRFSTYASWWVRASVQDFVLRNHSLVRIGSTAGQKTLFFNLARVKARLMRDEAGLTPDQLSARIAEDMGVSRAELALMERRMAGGDASLNMAAAGGDQDDGREWIDLIEDEAALGASQVMAHKDETRVRGWLGQALSQLTPRERLILTARHLGDAPRTLESLGAELGLSKERIRQIEAAACAKMRLVLAPQKAALIGHLAQ